MSHKVENQLLQLLKLLMDQHSCNDCHCGCPTDNVIEQSAARFNEQASQAAAISQQNFVNQQAAYAASLLELQSRVTRQGT